MRAAGSGDRVYGRALTSGGKTWLQYWLFSYYNPQNVFGFGVHEGDWEFIQAARRVRVARREGTVMLRLPPGSSGPYVVSASAFSERGARSPITRPRLG